MIVFSSMHSAEQWSSFILDLTNPLDNIMNICGHFLRYKCINIQTFQKGLKNFVATDSESLWETYEFQWSKLILHITSLLIQKNQSNQQQQQYLSLASFQETTSRYKDQLYFYILPMNNEKLILKIIFYNNIKSHYKNWNKMCVNHLHWNLQIIAQNSKVDFKNYLKAVEIKIVWFWHKVLCIYQWNKLVSRNMWTVITQSILTDVPK